MVLFVPERVLSDASAMHGLTHATYSLFFTTFLPDFPFNKGGFLTQCWGGPMLRCVCWSLPWSVFCPHFLWRSIQFAFSWPTDMSKCFLSRLQCGPSGGITLSISITWQALSGHDFSYLHGHALIWIFWFSSRVLLQWGGLHVMFSSYLFCLLYCIGFGRLFYHNRNLCCSWQCLPCVVKALTQDDRK